MKEDSVNHKQEPRANGSRTYPSIGMLVGNHSELEEWFMILDD